MHITANFQFPHYDTDPKLSHIHRILICYEPYFRYLLPSFGSNMQNDYNAHCRFSSLSSTYV
ncbi:hypothetical protein T4E_8775 [Trichinella pseudospiralis]|uniref:Uncharacterized protein n=1 Tax=Trichinella pseudospiralis TaxID=6337 RepID=A0A0V0XME4_TRIPS|nr:hypothetical protein T4E_8775 [Trichinella pseudospiralis]